MVSVIALLARNRVIGVRGWGSRGRAAVEVSERGEGDAKKAV